MCKRGRITHKLNKALRALRYTSIVSTNMKAIQSYNSKPIMMPSVVPVSILRKSISGRHRPVRVADGPMTARCRFT